MKIGDRIKIIRVDECWSNEHESRKYIGKYGKIVRLENGNYRLDVDGSRYAWLESELELCSRLDKLKRILK